jgi:hypothetical protein
MIGIDPDVEKSGVAIRYMGEPFKNTDLINKSFWDLHEYLELISTSGAELHIVVEAGHLNAKSNFRSGKMTALASDRVSREVGRNHQTGILIIEYLVKKGLSHELHVPRSPVVKKAIQSAEVFKQLTKLDVVCNPETRSAAMLVFERSWPITLRKKGAHV